jgi:Holliday junction resolvasome RuvABC endonuclease subunit
MASFFAIDPSLTSTGFAFRRNGQLILGHIDGTKRRGPGRLAFIEDRILEYMSQIKVTNVIYEDYAMGALGRVFDLGELGGVLKKAIWSRGIDLLIVPPNSLKLFILGKGGGPKIKKSDMAKVLFYKHKVKFETDDEADAFGLLLLGESYFAKPSGGKPPEAAVRRALEGCRLVRGHPTRMSAAR